MEANNCINQQADEKERIEKIDKLAKSLLKPYYATKTIDKMQYKEIMKDIVKHVSDSFSFYN